MSTPRVLPTSDSVSRASAGRGSTPGPTPEWRPVTLVEIGHRKRAEQISLNSTNARARVKPQECCSGPPVDSQRHVMQELGLTSSTIETGIDKKRCCGCRVSQPCTRSTRYIPTAELRSLSGGFSLGKGCSGQPFRLSRSRSSCRSTATLQRQHRLSSSQPVQPLVRQRLSRGRLQAQALFTGFLLPLYPART